MKEYELEVAPQITKNFLYDKIGQEKIMEHYLGVPVKKGLFVCPSILRNDRKPTCSFYKNSKGNLIFKDFAGISGDAISIVMVIFECSYYKALRIIANDFGLVTIPKYEINPPKIKYSGNVLEETKFAKINVKVKDFTTKELKWWSSFGINKETLKKYNVYSLDLVFLNDVFFTQSTESSPIFGYYGFKNSDKYELWRIYMPRKIKYRFLSNWSSNIIQGVRQLPKSGNSLIITKSLKDVMCLDNNGINSISPTSENVIMSNATISKLSKSFKELIVFFDCDLAGVKGANKYKKEYGLRTIFIKRKYAKDVSDLYKKLNYAQRIEMFNELNSIIKDKSIKKTKYFYIF